MTKKGKRRKRLASDPRFQEEHTIPDGAIPADPSMQVPNNSYSPPPLYYVDLEFRCRDCGREEIWTAEQQKWYYEDAKGSLYATAIRCRNCRRIHAERYSGRGDPNLIKHEGSAMKRLRALIEPSLMAAGFQIEEGRSSSHSTWPIFTRPGLTLLCTFRHGRLLAETMDDAADVQIVASVELLGVGSTLLQAIDDFGRKICEHVEKILKQSKIDERRQ